MLALCFLTSGREKLRKRLLTLGLACMVLSFAKVPYTGAAYTQLSVGDEDAAILRDGETVVVVDTGTDGLTIADMLHRQRLDIDYLFITHLHEDHAGGIAALLEKRIPVGVCILPWGAVQADVEPTMATLIDQLSAAGTEIRDAGRGDTIPLPSGGITVLWPETGRVRPGNEANESSLALMAEIRGSTMLLMGDVDGTYEQYVQIPADILKAAHHGAAGETGEDFLAAVEPRAVIVSCGRNGVDDGLRARLGSLPVYTTEEYGAVTIAFQKGTFTISGTLR